MRRGLHTPIALAIGVVALGAQSSCASRSLWDWAREPTAGVRRSPLGWTESENETVVWFEAEDVRSGRAYEWLPLRGSTPQRTSSLPSEGLHPLEARWQHPNGPASPRSELVHELRATKGNDAHWNVLAWDEEGAQWHVVTSLPRDERTRSPSRLIGAVLLTPPTAVFDLLTLPIWIVL